MLDVNQGKLYTAFNRLLYSKTASIVYIAALIISVLCLLSSIAALIITFGNNLL